MALDSVERRSRAAIVNAACTNHPRSLRAVADRVAIHRRSSRLPNWTGVKKSCPTSRGCHLVAWITTSLTSFAPRDDDCVTSVAPTFLVVQALRANCRTGSASVIPNLFRDLSNDTGRTQRWIDAGTVLLDSRKTAPRKAWFSLCASARSHSSE